LGRKCLIWLIAYGSLDHPALLGDPLPGMLLEITEQAASSCSALVSILLLEIPARPHPPLNENKGVYIAPKWNPPGAWGVSGSSLSILSTTYKS